jgi:hypothetical protein
VQAKAGPIPVLLLLSLGCGSGAAQMFPPPLRESTGRIRWASYVQLRYTAVNGGEDLPALRRWKLMVGGDLSPRIQWYAQGLFKDGNDSPTDGRVYFQEAWLRFAWSERMQLAVGQFKPPFGRERFTPDFEIYTMDRSLVTDALTPDGPYIDSFYRDRGVQIDGELHRGWRYAVGVFDGRGANHQFRGIGPMVVSQLLHRPLRERMLKGEPLTVQWGIATGFRRGRDLPFRPCCAEAIASGVAHFQGADQRWGLEVSADWGNSSVRAEYMRARLRFAQTPETSLTADGWYVQAAKFLRPKLQAVAKVEGFDPNVKLLNGKDIRQTTVGLNYYFRKNRLKAMAAYVVRQERIRPVANHVFQCQLQAFIH